MSAYGVAPREFRTKIPDGGLSAVDVKEVTSPRGTSARTSFDERVPIHLLARDFSREANGFLLRVRLADPPFVLCSVHELRIVSYQFFSVCLDLT